MSEGFPYGDLVVLGAIAAFIILRYRSVLGQKTGHDFSKKKEDGDTSEAKDRVIQMPESHIKRQSESVSDKQEEIALADIEDTKVSAALAKMKTIDEHFTLGSFMEGAKAAFEMVVEAYSNHDKDTLKMLLAKDIYKEFESSIKDQEAKKQRSQTTLVSVSNTDIVEADITKSTATITVQFSSEQINVVVDENDEVVEGNRADIQDIEDEWVFERDLKSKNPNWTIIDT